MLIIHGDDTLSSRNLLNQELEDRRRKSTKLHHLEAKNTDITQLTQLLESNSLFGDSPCLIIEGILSTTKSKSKDAIVEFLSNHQDSDVILYEDKKLTATALKPFPKAKMVERKPEPLVFTFVDSLRPGSSIVSLKYLDKLEESGQPAEMIFFMLIRQVRMLISALQPNMLKLAPWQKTKIISQSRAFGEERLLKLHHKLFQIDRDIKTGLNPTPLYLRLYNLILDI